MKATARWEMKNGDVVAYYKEDPCLNGGRYLYVGKVGYYFLIKIDSQEYVDIFEKNIHIYMYNDDEFFNFVVSINNPSISPDYSTAQSLSVYLM